MVGRLCRRQVRLLAAAGSPGAELIRTRHANAMASLRRIAILMLDIMTTTESWKVRTTISKMDLGSSTALTQIEDHHVNNTTSLSSLDRTMGRNAAEGRQGGSTALRLAILMIVSLRGK